MKLKRIHYSALINLGNYSNERIGFTVQVTEDERIEDVIEALREKVKEVGGQNANDLYNEQSNARQQLRELERKLLKAKQDWTALAEFLRAQGINPDAPNVPLLTNLLPESKVEDEIVHEGEVEVDDEDDDEAQSY